MNGIQKNDSVSRAFRVIGMMRLALGGLAGFVGPKLSDRNVRLMSHFP
jgi:hypothetical protein